MKFIFKSIGILLGLLIVGYIFLLTPDYVEGRWTDFGEKGNSSIIIFGLIPIVILILIDLEILDIYSLPFSDVIDEGVRGLLYIPVIIASVNCSCFDSSFGNAISFILAIFIMIFPLYLFYRKLIREKLKNKFIKKYLTPIIFGCLIVLSIGVSYILTLFDTYLPGNMFLGLGEKSLIAGLVTIPTLYFYSICGLILYFIYLVIQSIVLSIINKFRPEKKYKYATYESKNETEDIVENSSYRGVKCCKNCRYRHQKLLYGGRTAFVCDVYGVPTDDYQSCDRFKP